MHLDWLHHPHSCLICGDHTLHLSLKSRESNPHLTTHWCVQQILVAFAEHSATHEISMVRLTLSAGERVYCTCMITLPLNGASPHFTNWRLRFFKGTLPRDLLTWVRRGWSEWYKYGYGHGYFANTQSSNFFSLILLPLPVPYPYRYRQVHTGAHTYYFLPWHWSFYMTQEILNLIYHLIYQKERKRGVPIWYFFEAWWWMVG